MANSVQDLSQIIVPLPDTIPPQQLTASTPGNAVKVTLVGVDRLNARLAVGAAVGLVSLDVKMQASVDGVTGWTDINDQGSLASFTTVTVANAPPQIIPFQLPAALTATSPGFIYVRALPTLVGTSIYCEVAILGVSKFGAFGVGFQNQPPVIN